MRPASRLEPVLAERDGCHRVDLVDPATSAVVASLNVDWALRLASRLIDAVHDARNGGSR